VPEGKDLAFKSQLPNRNCDVTGGYALESTAGPAFSTFEVSRLKNDRQRLLVSATWCGHGAGYYESWYEADSRRVYPKYRKTLDLYWGESLFASIGVHAMALALILYRRKKNRRIRS